MRRQEGQAVVLIALMLAVLIGMVALAVDGSRGYALRRDLQAAVDAAALAAGDKLQQGGGYSTAEQAATAVFGVNLRLYSSPTCNGYGSPGVVPVTVTCTYADGTQLTQVVAGLGPQGSSFTIAARRTLQLDFARVLTNGTPVTLGAAATGAVGNLAYAPAVAALNQAGCGGTTGSALTVNGSGPLKVVGDVVSNGAISISNTTMQVAGDIYARCQPSVAGASNTCYSSGNPTPCSSPDVAGTTRSGLNLADPRYPAPTQLGTGQGIPTTNVNLQPGIYTAIPPFGLHHCWFLGAGVYTWQAGFSNLTDVVSNELKPPDEPDPSNNTLRAANQFWNVDGVNCAGGVEVSSVSGPRDIPFGKWSFVVTSTRTDTYGGVTFTRESAPSVCNQVTVNKHNQSVQITVSNVPGATAYNIYAAPPGNDCGGPFGLAASLAVTGPVTNTNTSPCPLFTGLGCSLGHESITLDTQLAPPFAPNPAAAPGASGAYAPDGEQAPIAVGLPNQNAGRGSGAAGDRANENRCATSTGTWTACPASVTPGAVEFYVPAGGCISTLNVADTFVFSGYQYDWIAAYEPSANNCTNGLGGGVNSAYIGLFYAPGASVNVASPNAFESAGTAGLMANYVTFGGTMPVIRYSSSYAPVPPASRLTS